MDKDIVERIDKVQQDPKHWSREGTDLDALLHAARTEIVRLRHQSVQETSMYHQRVSEENAKLREENAKLRASAAALKVKKIGK